MHFWKSISSLLLSSLLVSGAPISDLTSRAARTSPPSGCLVVRASGAKSGEYGTIKSAVAALGSATTSKCIFIYSGTYKEQLELSYKGALTIYGETTELSSYKNNKVSITNTINSATAGSLDKSATVVVKSANFKAYNINFKNGYGKGSQAVAISAQGDKQGYYGCGFYGYQDTLYAKSGKQYYSNCYIEGAVDFIFGAAAAWFGECTIAANGAGYITANSREQSSDTTWYVFDHSTITSTTSLTNKVYLGRPWRVLARVMYQNSVLPDIIRPEGWTEMADNATPYFTEYANTGAGASTSSRKYFTKSNSAVTKATLFGDTSWIDNSY